MLFSAEDHASNPPESWEVVKAAPRLWALRTAGGDMLQSYPHKGMADADRVTGYFVQLYEKERRWYAGEQVSGWRPYAEVRAENERRMAWLASR